MWAAIRALRLIVTANIEFHSAPLGPEHSIFTGTPAEIAVALARPNALGRRGSALLSFA
jgi:hypothetical protein